MKLISTFLTWLAISVAFCVVVLQAVYDHQWIDLYEKEWSSFNSGLEMGQLNETNEKPAILVQGDSFTAGLESFPNVLRKANPGYLWYNGGISGSGVREALLTAPRRFKQARPKVFIYQIYVGNDLIDLGYHPDWSRYTIKRNLWWTTTRRFPSVAYVRRRIQERAIERDQMREVVGVRSDSAGINRDSVFSFNAYNERVKLYYTLDPTVLDDSIRLNGIRKKDFEEFVPLVKKLLSYCQAPGCKAVVFVVPHKAQVSREYFDNEKVLGAVLPDAGITADEDYPFLNQLRSSLASDGILVLSPLKKLREHEQRLHRVFFLNDDHLNPFGQQKLAEWLMEELKSKIKF